MRNAGLQPHLGGSSATVLPTASPPRWTPSPKGINSRKSYTAAGEQGGRCFYLLPARSHHCPPAPSGRRPARSRVQARARPRTQASSFGGAAFRPRPRRPPSVPVLASAPRALTTIRRCHIRPASDAVSSSGSRASTDAGKLLRRRCSPSASPASASASASTSKKKQTRY